MKTSSSRDIITAPVPGINLVQHIFSVIYLMRPKSEGWEGGDRKIIQHRK